MERQRISKLKWSDILVWPGLIGVCLAGFALWVLLRFDCQMPDDVRVGYIIFLITGVLISLLKMKTILEYDGEFLYVISIRFFVHYVSCKILMRDVKEVQIFPDWWARRTPWELFCYKFSRLPKEGRTFWRVLGLMIKCSFYPFIKNMHNFDDENVIYTYSKVNIVYNGGKCSFRIKRHDDVWAFIRQMKEDLAKRGNKWDGRE